MNGVCNKFDIMNLSIFLTQMLSIMFALFSIFGDILSVLSREVVQTKVLLGSNIVRPVVWFVN